MKMVFWRRLVFKLCAGRVKEIDRQSGGRTLQSGDHHGTWGKWSCTPGTATLYQDVKEKWPVVCHAG